MTANEAANLLRYVRAEYPESFRSYDAKMTQDRILMWCKALEDYTYEQALCGLKIYISSDKTGFAPHVGQIIDKITEFSTDADMTPDEAWGYVVHAVSNSGYEAEQEFAKLPDAVKDVVRSPERLRTMGMMDLNEFHTVERSHFLREYRAIVERRKEIARIPASVREKIGIATGSWKAIGTDNGKYLAGKEEA